MSLLCRCLVVATLILAATETPSAETRHNHLVRAEPGTDSTVRHSPERIELWFSEQPDLALTTVRLRPTDDSTRLVGLGPVKVGADPHAVVAVVESSIPPGNYTVLYRTAGDDGHVVKGSYRFTLAK